MSSCCKHLACRFLCASWKLAPLIVAFILAPPAGAQAATAGVVVLETDNTTDVAEGGVPNSTDSFTVALSSQPLYDVAVMLSTDDGQTSVSPVDLTFTPLNWNTFQAVTVTAVDDTLIEGPHTGSITYLTSSSDPDYDGLFPSNPIWVNIEDNDHAIVSLSLTDGTANEDGDQAAVMVSRTEPGPAPFAAALEVNLSIGGTATPGADYAMPGVDYAAIEPTVTIPAGRASMAIAIIPIDDNEFEQDETVIVSVSPATSAYYTVGTPASATVTIYDNEMGLGGGCGLLTTSMRPEFGALELFGALLPLLLLAGVAMGCRVKRCLAGSGARNQEYSAAHVHKGKEGTK